MQRLGIQAKLIRVFLLQILVISAATLLGVYAAAKIVEDSLMREALEGEAEHYWLLFDVKPDYPRPNTRNLLGYLAINDDFSEVPQALRSLAPGYTRAPLQDRNPIVYVSDHGNARLFLVFDEEQVSALAFYFGIMPLSIILLIIYLLSWVAYRQSHRAVSPIVQLAKAMDSFDIHQDSFSDLNLDHVRNKADAEVMALLEALDHFTERLEGFIERERQFTRDASHELRTPLAVIKGSMDLLRKRSDFNSAEQKALHRITDTVNDMEALLQTLLLLAREDEGQLPETPIVLNDLVVQLIDKQAQVINKHHIGISIQDDCLLELNAPEKVLSILIGNLTRNAFNYTREGQVTIRIEDKKISVEDSGIGMSANELAQVFKPFYRADKGAGGGYGLGLTIIKRLCNRFGWQVQVNSTPGKGTTVSIYFPQARRVGSKHHARAD